LIHDILIKNKEHFISIYNECQDKKETSSISNYIGSWLGYNYKSIQSDIKKKSGNDKHILDESEMEFYDA